jgi:hypothetical protein
MRARVLSPAMMDFSSQIKHLWRMARHLNLNNNPSLLISQKQQFLNINNMKLKLLLIVNIISLIFLNVNTQWELNFKNKVFGSITSFISFLPKILIRLMSS